LYGFCLVLSTRRLSSLHRLSPELGTAKLLVLSVGLVCVLRIMTVLGVAAMNIANVRAHYSLHPTDHHGGGGGGTTQQNQPVQQAFYDEAMTVLFDLPNCIVVSTYILFTLVWAECFLEARHHTESAIQWKRTWLKLYMVFNSALYASQLSMYALVFATTAHRVVRTALYAAITLTNFTAVLLVLGIYFYLGLRFSGFPFRSPHLRDSLNRISYVMSMWSITRLVWGVSTGIVFLKNIELLDDSKTPFQSSLCLLLLFVGCEIMPILALLDHSYSHMLKFEHRRVFHRSALDACDEQNLRRAQQQQQQQQQGGGDDDDDDGDDQQQPFVLAMDRQPNV